MMIPRFSIKSLGCGSNEPLRNAKRFYLRFFIFIALNYVISIQSGGFYD
jgi:hypothetical protein